MIKMPGLAIMQQQLNQNNNQQNRHNYNRPGNEILQNYSNVGSRVNYTRDNNVQVESNLQNNYRPEEKFSHSRPPANETVNAELLYAHLHTRNGCPFHYRYW